MQHDVNTIWNIYVSIELQVGYNEMLFNRNLSRHSH